jgi:cytoskeletal protein RodZ
MAVINSVEIIVTDNLLYVFSASASIVAVVSVVFYFASAFEAEPETKPAVENAPEAKEEKVEETKVEEAKEETTEAKENPYKSNFSSDSVFDVQDEEEKK